MGHGQTRMPGEDDDCEKNCVLVPCFEFSGASHVYTKWVPAASVHAVGAPTPTFWPVGPSPDTCEGEDPLFSSPSAGSLVTRVINGAHQQNHIAVHAAERLANYQSRLVQQQLNQTMDAMMTLVQDGYVQSQQATEGLVQSFATLIQEIIADTKGIVEAHASRQRMETAKQVRDRVYVMMMRRISGIQRLDWAYRRKMVNLSRPMPVFPHGPLYDSDCDLLQLLCDFSEDSSDSGLYIGTTNGMFYFCNPLVSQYFTSVIHHPTADGTEVWTCRSVTL